MIQGNLPRLQTNKLVLAGALLVVGIIGFLDYITVWELSFFAFYAIPLFAVAWTCPKSIAIGFATLCAVVEWAVNLPTAPNIPIHSWRSLNRTVSFAFVAVAGVTLRMQREHYRSHLAAIERTRELEQEIIRISEHEQRRIGQDLHDGVCQNLAAIDCATSMLRAKLEALAPREAKAVGEIQDLLQKTLIETRFLARGIFPVQVEKEGIAVALEELVVTAGRLHGQPVSIEIDGEIDIKDPEISMHLYRIAQEALSNAIRHAKANAIKVTFRQDDRRCTLAIKDDGSGIRSAHPKGMGLRTIQYRSHLIGAEIVISDSPPRGTLVQCFVTLPSNGSQS
jgi:signal transduction histidine kinase